MHLIASFARLAWVCLVGAPMGLLVASYSPSDLSAGTLAAEVLNATAFAIIYGYPILPYVQLVYPVLATTGANALHNEPALANAQVAIIVRPNVDTIYSVAPIDLSHTNVEVSVPEIPDDRFYVVPFYDLYGNNFANFGSVNKSAPGKYLLRMAESVPGLELESNASSPYQGYINFPTTYGLLFFRILLRNNGSDIAVTNSIRNQISFSLVQREKQLTPAPPYLTQSLLNTTLDPATAALTFPGGFNASATAQLLDLTARLVPYNLPESKSDTSRVSTTLKIAGLSKGYYVPPPGLNYTLAGLMANGSISTILKQPASYIEYGNYWRSLLPSLSGDFHSTYTVRAYVAWSGYLQLVSYESLYPEYFGPDVATSSANLLALKANESLLFTFSGKPPVYGFWSLTAYGEDNFLIPNPLDRFSLGDRSNLTYSDGTLVYPNITAPETGATGHRKFQILMQSANVPPPANWTSNWLPAPAGGGSFSVNLRWYGPSLAFEDKKYVEPLVTKQGAFHAA